MCAENRRKVDIRITGQGLALLEEADKPMMELTGTYGSLSNAEADQLNELLDKLRG